MSLYSETSPANTDMQNTWARLFGHLIQDAREPKGSVEEIAGRADMTAADWSQMEAGQVPTTVQQLQAVARALEMEWGDMADLVLLCSRAWGC